MKLVVAVLLLVVATAAATGPGKCKPKCTPYTECDACQEMFKYWADRGEPISDVTDSYCDVWFAQSFLQVGEEPAAEAEEGAGKKDRTVYCPSCVDPLDLCHKVESHLKEDYEVRDQLNRIIRDGCDDHFPCTPMKACSLLTGGAGAGFCNADIPALENAFVSIQSLAHEDHYVSHEKYLGKVLHANGTTSDKKTLRRASWKIVPGLLGKVREEFSFESLDYPGYYLRHFWYKMVLGKPAVEDPRFNETASFTIERGLANKHWNSFQSVDFPGYYIRMRDDDLFLERESDLEHGEEATFRFVKPLAPPAVKDADKASEDKSDTNSD